MRSSIKLLLLICLASCSVSKDVRHKEKPPIPKTKVDDLFDPKLRSFGKKGNSVLLLLPMSGNNESIGRNILNACLLAVDNSRNIDFHLIDTANTSIEKCKMYDYFKDKNLKAIIGPVFFHEIKPYSALFPDVPILSFSNNLKINRGHIFACGLSLQDEIQALMAYANSQEINSFLIMLPEGDIGTQILEILEDELKKYGLEEGDDLEIIRYSSISRKAATKYAKNSNKKAVFVINPILTISKLKDIRVFTVSSAALSNSEAWDGVIFAFSDNDELRKFSERYNANFGVYPNVLDIIGHDLMKIVREFINLQKPIVGNHHQGCMGEFLIDKNTGPKRDLQIFRMENSQKKELTKIEVLNN
ncbi:MAG: penicillin-binding protein activator [Holosporaceae bacterium]|nr:penicillin-binding protein activator [Holosporaceae bacterium]